MGFELTILVVIGTDCTGSWKSNYHTIRSRPLRPLLSTGYSYNEPKHLIRITFFIKDFDLFSLLLSSWNFSAASFAVFRLTSNNLCHWQIALSRVCKSFAMKVLERDDFLAIVRSNSYLVALLLVTQHTWKLGNKTIIVSWTGSFYVNGIHIK